MQTGTLPTSKLPQHGFARTSKWAWKGIVAETNDELSAAFSLTPAAVNPELYAMWPHPFELTYTVTLRGKDVLETSLKVDNKGSEAFEFTALLHTYFAAEDISKCAVSGMQG